MIDIRASFLHDVLWISVGNTVSEVEEYSKKDNVLRVMHTFEAYNLCLPAKKIRALCINPRNFATEPLGVSIVVVFE